MMDAPETITITLTIEEARMLPDALWAVINAHDTDCEDPGSEGIDAIDELALTIRNARINAEQGDAKC